MTINRQAKKTNKFLDYFRYNDHKENQVEQNKKEEPEYRTNKKATTQNWKRNKLEKNKIQKPSGSKSNIAKPSPRKEGVLQVITAEREDPECNAQLRGRQGILGMKPMSLSSLVGMESIYHSLTNQNNFFLLVDNDRESLHYV